jgi:hypothetical protein
MRRCVVACAVLLAAPAAIQASPLDIAGPRGELALVKVADVDSQYRVRSGEYGNWRYRALHTRWLHNEYVRAGHPVRHPSRRTYSRW